MKLPPDALHYLTCWRHVNDLHRSAGFCAEKFNHSGDYGEAILRSVWNATRRKPGHSPAVDLVLPDGKTVQVKTTNRIHNPVPIPVMNLLIILPLSNRMLTIRILNGTICPVYSGGKYPHQGDDNKRRPSKRMIEQLQTAYGFSEYAPAAPRLYTFC